MDTFISLLAALFIGAALARITIIIIERRRRSQGKPPPSGPGIIGSPAQRIRAAWIAVIITAAGIGVMMSGYEQAGWLTAAVGIILAVQAGLFELIDRGRRR